MSLSEDEFTAYLRERMDNEAEDASQGSGTVQASDLYLACACAKGDAAALAAFEAMCIPEIDAAVRRFRGAIAADEIKQLLRNKLFVGDGDVRPKILEYAGRGKLKTWLRITATRLALNMVARQDRERPFERDAIAHIIGAGEDPELMYLKRRYAEEFKLAFGEAFAGLEGRERNLLRYAFGEGLTVDVIGSLYGVHRATAARWITKAHEALVDRIRTAMLARLKVGKEEYASILRLIESRIEISFERYLGEKEPEPGTAERGVGT